MKSLEMLWLVLADGNLGALRREPRGNYLEGVKMDGKCQISDCTNPAKYALYNTCLSGEKKWLHVCVKHDKEIGHENILRARRLAEAKQ